MSENREDSTSLPMPGDAPEATAERISAARRTLLKAGWVAPVIVALNLPKNSYAVNISGATTLPPTTEPPLPPLPTLPPAPPWWWPKWLPWPPWGA